MGYPQAEEARTRGTPVTAESFFTWKSKFYKEMAARRVIEQEERLKGLPVKERDEHRKIGTRLTGLHPSASPRISHVSVSHSRSAALRARSELGYLGCHSCRGRHGLDRYITIRPHSQYIGNRRGRGVTL
jgi:hypothetical protein